MFIDLRERGRERGREERGERGLGRDRERERERERGKHQWDKETLIGCLPHVPKPRTEHATFWCAGQCSSQLSHTAKAVQFNSLLLWSELTNKNET